MKACVCVCVCVLFLVLTKEADLMENVETTQNVSQLIFCILVLL
jgi:hypothetical protein